MYILKFVPVNIGKDKQAIYSEKCVYPVDILLDTVEKIQAKGEIKQNDEDQYFSYADNYITFKHQRELRWCVSDVYLAYEAYKIAEVNNFFFYSICNAEGNPMLFISKEFKKTRIIVNPLTMQAVLLTDVLTLRHINSLLRKTLTSEYCLLLFDVLCKRELDKSSILDALVLWRDKEDEALIVNPVTSMYSEYTNFYGVEVIESYRQILAGNVVETDYCKREGDTIMRTGEPDLPAMPLKHCQYIVDMYDRYKSKKSDYECITDEEAETQFYVSTNMMYVVDALTFECYKIMNQQLRDLLQSYVSNNNYNSITSMIELRYLLNRGFE